MEVTLPHSFTPRDYQLPFLEAWDKGYKGLVIVWHRRSGKDKTSFANLVKKALQKKGTYFYFAPTYRQGRKIIWQGMDKDGFQFLDHIPKEIRKNINDQEMSVELINGSRIQVVGTDNVDSVVGTNPIGCVFTEFSLQHQKAWDLIRPILAENNGWAVFVFTPRGMNHGWKILQQAQENPDEWYSEILTVDDTNAISKKALEKEKKEMPADLFEQEYYCKFIEGAGQFFKNVEKYVWSGELEPETGKIYQMGLDLAKYHDFTVLTTVDTHTFRVGKQDRFNQMDWRTQKKSIEAFARKYNNGMVYVDSTGVGDPIFEDLEDAGLMVEPFKFTTQSRFDLLNNLRLYLEQGKIQIPDDPILINELKSFQLSLSERGRTILEVPEGLHDDCVMSLALAVWNLGTPRPQPGRASLFRLQDVTVNDKLGDNE